MIVKTKKYQLPKKTYIKLGMMNMLKNQWWYVVAPVAVAAIAFLMPEYKWWFISFALIMIIGYILFWVIQFAGVTQLPQNQVMFEKLSYEIDSRQILIRLNQKQGSPMQWNQIQSAYKGKEEFVLIISKGQFIHLPFRIFNSENDLKFFEAILRRKEYLKQ